MYSCQEPSLPLHLQSVWGLDADRVGILLLALSVPMLFCVYLMQCLTVKQLNLCPASFLTGWLTDILGAEWTTTFSMVLAIPWLGVLTINGSLALFAVAFAFESELARNTEGP